MIEDETLSDWDKLYTPTQIEARNKSNLHIEEFKKIVDNIQAEYPELDFKLSDSITFPYKNGKLNAIIHNPSFREDINSRIELMWKEFVKTNQVD